MIFDHTKTSATAALWLLAVVNGAPANALSQNEFDRLKPFLFYDGVDTIRSALSSMLSWSGIDASVEVNSAEPSGLRFYIIDVQKLLQSNDSGVVSGVDLRQVRRNVIVDADGEIFIDRDFISLVILNAFSDMIGSAQVVGESQKILDRGGSMEEVEQFAGLMGSVTDLTRLETIRKSRGSLNDPWNPRNAAQRVVLAADEHQLTDLISFALAPVILHEIGHIQTQTSGAFLKRVLKSKMAYQIRDAEEQADAYAVYHLKLMLEDYSKARPRGALLMNSQASIATLKLLRDEVYFEAFDGLRGLPAEDYRARIYYKDCSEEPDLIKQPINSVERIDYVLDMTYPLLTAAEFNRVRDGFLASMAGGTHSHHFARAAEYARSIASVTKIDSSGVLLENDRAFAAFLNNRPDQLQERPDARGIGVSFDYMRDGFENGFAFEPAVNCRECWVGLPLSGSGFGSIELYGPMENLSEAVLNVRVKRPDASDPEEREYVFAAGEMISFIFHAHGEAESMNLLSFDNPEEYFRASPILNFVHEARSASLECGAVYESQEIDGRLNEIRTIGEGGWLQVRVVAAE